MKHVCVVTVDSRKQQHQHAPRSALNLSHGCVCCCCCCCVNVGVSCFTSYSHTTSATEGTHTHTHLVLTLILRFVFEQNLTVAHNETRDRERHGGSSASTMCDEPQTHDAFAAACTRNPRIGPQLPRTNGTNAHIIFTKSLAHSRDSRLSRARNIASKAKCQRSPHIRHSVLPFRFSCPTIERSCRRACAAALAHHLPPSTPKHNGQSE